MHKELLMYGRGRRAFLDGLTFQKIKNDQHQEVDLSMRPERCFSSPMTGL